MVNQLANDTPQPTSPAAAQTAAENETWPKEAAGEIKKKPRRIIIWLIIILLLLPIFYYLFKIFLAPKNYGGLIEVNQPANAINPSQKIGLATTTASAKSAQAIAASENFDLRQISLEGSGANIFDFGEPEIFTLGQITSELYSTRSGAKSEIRAVISCQTNKRSYVEVAYFKSGEKEKKVIQDESLGLNHVLVIPALDPDAVYKYSVSATDLNQTKISSEPLAFYTGAGNLSWLDILSQAVQKVFGWARGK